MSPASAYDKRELELTQRGNFVKEIASWLVSTSFHFTVGLFVGLANTFLPFLPVSAPLNNGYSPTDFESYEERLHHAEDRILETCPKEVERMRVKVACGSGETEHEIATLHVVQDNHKSKPPVIFIHGYGSAGVMWTQHFADFSEHYDVYAVDMVGWGRSSRPSSLDHVLDGLSMQLEWVDHLEQWRRQIGLDPIVIVGHSLGSIIGTRWALRYPNSIAHLVNVNMGGLGETSGKHTYNFGVMFSYTPQRATRELGRVGQHMFDKGCRLDPQHPHQSRLRAFLNTLWEHPEPSGEILFRKMYDFKNFFTQIHWNCPLLPQLHTLKMPVTLIHGAKDFMIPLAHVQKAATHIPDVRLRVLHNAEHAPHIEAADEWRATVLEELAQCRTGKRAKNRPARRHVRQASKEDLRPGDHHGTVSIPIPPPVLLGVLFAVSVYVYAYWL